MCTLYWSERKDIPNMLCYTLDKLSRLGYSARRLGRDRKTRGGPRQRACCRWGISRPPASRRDRKSTRLNSSHLVISYAVFCLKKKKKQKCSPICSPLQH